MRILVTGGAGFVGRALCRVLLERGHEVDVVDNLVSGGPVPPGVRFIYGDVCDKETWDGLPGYDVVAHLAASFANQRSVDRPHEDAAWNIVGTIHAARFAKAHGVRLIYTGSSSSYGVPNTFNGLIQVFSESNALRPTTPYALSKKVGEDYVRLLVDDALIFRLFNVFGPGDPPGPYRNAIPNMVRDAKTKGVVTVMGSGVSRDFTYIDTVAKVLARGVEVKEWGPFGIYNICSGQEHWIADVAQAIANRYGARINYVARRSWDKVERRCGDNARISVHVPEIRDESKKFWLQLDRTMDWLDKFIEDGNAA